MLERNKQEKRRCPSPHIRRSVPTIAATAPAPARASPAKRPQDLVAERAPAAAGARRRRRGSPPAPAAAAARAPLVRGLLLLLLLLLDLSRPGKAEGRPRHVQGLHVRRWRLRRPAAPFGGGLHEPPGSLGQREGEREVEDGGVEVDDLEHESRGDLRLLQLAAGRVRVACRESGVGWFVGWF